MDLMLDKLGEDEAFQQHVRVVGAMNGGPTLLDPFAESVDMGWGALCPPWWTHGLMVHVLEPYLRNGVGTAIVQALLRHAEAPPRVFRGTERASLFWDRFGARVG